MSLFRVYVDGALFYHPQMSKLAITAARIEEDAENIDSMTLSAPFNHPYLSAIRPLASTIVCKKGDAVVFEGRALDNGTDFYNTHTWTCESCLAYLKDSVQPPYDYKGTLRGLLELFISVHNNTVEEKKRFVVGNVTVTDNNDYISYSSVDFTVTLDAIRDKLIKTHGGFLRVRYTGGVKYLDYIPGLIESNRIAVLVLCIPDIGQFLRFRCRRPCRAAVFHQRNRMAGVIDLVPEISGCRTGRCRLRDVALQRVYFSLIRANNHIRHKTTEIVLHGEAADGEHLRYIRIGLILHSNDIHIVLAVVGHGAAVGLNIHDVRALYSQRCRRGPGDIGPGATTVFCPLVGRVRDRSRAFIGRGCQRQAAGPIMKRPTPMW